MPTFSTSDDFVSQVLEKAITKFAWSEAGRWDLTRPAVLSRSLRVFIRQLALDGLVTINSEEVF